MIHEWVTGAWEAGPTVRFTDSSGLTELRKAVTLMVTVHCSEKIQTQISKRQSPGETRHELQMSQWAAFHPPNNDMWQHARRITNQGSSLKPPRLEFGLGLSRASMADSLGG